MNIDDKLSDNLPKSIHLSHEVVGRQWASNHCSAKRAEGTEALHKNAIAWSMGSPREQR